jgi:hypothetical protein
VGRRLFPAALVALAALADSQGSHHFALDALLAAVPFAAVASIGAFGRYLDNRDDPVVALQGLLWGACLVLLVLSCAVRSDAVHGVPALGISTMVACLGLFGIKACFAVAPFVRRLAALRPAKP